MEQPPVPIDFFGDRNLHIAFTWVHGRLLACHAHNVFHGRNRHATGVASLTKATTNMKKTLLLAACAVSLSAFALPTYEPFTEYASLVAANSTNSIDLCTSGLSAPNGELWI